MQVNKVLLLMVFCIVLIGNVGAESQTLGTFKQNTCIELAQTCQNCTYNNISRVLYPNSTIALSNVVMTKDDTYYNYTFCTNNQIGEYVVNGFGDLDGVKTSWTYSYFVTRSGLGNSNIWIALVLYIVILTFNFLLLYKKNKMVGGMVFLISGVAIMSLDPHLSMAGFVLTLSSIVLIVYDLLPKKPSVSSGRWISGARRG